MLRGVYILLICLTFMSISLSSLYAEDRALKLKQHKAEKRIAVVIGNSDYASSPLKNPKNDAKAMSKTLRELNFKVYDYYNLSQNDIKRAINKFNEPANRGGTALFFFAGHGIQSKGNNYLIPINAQIETEADVEFESVNLNRVMAKMDEAGNRVNIVMLDACRNNPYARSYRSASQGLATVDAPSGSFIAYATAPGKVASDGDGKNGVFTGAFINILKNTKGITIEKIFKLVRTEVRKSTNGEQIPWTSSSMEGDFYFSPSEDAIMQQQVLANIKKSNRPRQTVSSYTDSFTGMKFQKIPHGCFKMGASSSEKFSSSDETPAHKVCIGEFYMGTYEVTQAEWSKVMGINPSHFQSCGGECPVENISWIDANKFIKKLNSKTGKNYRLPTEAEWEYAARDKGSINSTPLDISTLAWYSQNSNGKTHKVGNKQANKLGLYDMLGNVQEWCSDYYENSFYVFSPLNNPQGPDEGTRRVLRGGSWAEERDRVRLTNRRQSYPDGTNPYIGFRLVFND